MSIAHPEGQDAGRWRPWLAILAILVATGLYLWLSGRSLICDCGYVLLFTGADDPGGSLHVSDWYTLSHVIHGFLFYAALWLVARKVPLRWRLVIAVAVEAVWEIFENSAFIIERYRAVTISLDYNGDTVLNSICDILAMMLGFWAARRLPVWGSVVAILAFEALAAWAIRDGLALNILMLIWPLQAVLDWQAGG
ncbi:DUF2585 family protein [Frigidibacter sp. ROC022]|uniref:DUF2585 family protein n=1 Tax=Frigidibacter sp. ROC022 TaxID=2971796 RepID=UPI00215A80FB|nr:DUF2585 family protein [Frigidibacter sp. ROC022]MCR8724230.1 DUF2585 family protein [Frigidibacter sp. ROC022]